MGGFFLGWHKKEKTRPKNRAGLDYLEGYLDFLDFLDFLR